MEVHGVHQFGVPERVASQFGLYNISDRFTIDIAVVVPLFGGTDFDVLPYLGKLSARQRFSPAVCYHECRR